jgi:four helix bundle protein
MRKGTISHRAHEKTATERRLSKTASFQTAALIYDATYRFCEKFIDPRLRTLDQMIQAARSGRQNIMEGSRAAATSSQAELRLINAAGSSLEELLFDYEDYLRHRYLKQWAPSSREASTIREVPKLFKRDRTDPPDMTDLSDQERWVLYALYFMAGA